VVLEDLDVEPEEESEIVGVDDGVCDSDMDGVGVFEDE